MPGFTQICVYSVCFYLLSTGLISLRFHGRSVFQQCLFHCVCLFAYESNETLWMWKKIYRIKEEDVCLLFAWKLNNIAIGTDMFR